MSRIEKLLKAIINNTTYDEPRLSRIEEIFYSILNSLPYNANAQSRIEALLLALKESGLYDKRTLSRIEEILKCKLDGRTYTGWIGSRVEMLLNEWELSEIIEATFTSFPIIIKANGEPLIDYTIYGNMSQTGTPTHDNPIQPQETGERTGNLWNAIKYRYTSLSDSDVWTYNASLTGSVYRIPCQPNTTYTLYLTENVDITIWRIRELSTDGAPNASSTSVPTTETYASTVPASKSATFTTSASAKYILFQSNESAYDSILPVIMLIEGTTKIPYEPYGYKLDISSANTTTPVYLGEVESTRRIRKLVLTGEENWDVYSGFSAQNCYQFNTNITNHDVNSEAISTHFTYTAVLRTLIDNDGTFMFDSNTYIRVHISSCTTLEDFKSYLAAQYAAGTPVTVWYVLATEETGIVNEPLMKIGDYADTLSMEQTGVSIPTVKGNTVIDVETTLKPSEMYVKYNGEGTRVYITADGKLYITSNNEIYILKR